MTAPSSLVVYLLLFLGSLAQKICCHSWELSLTLLSLSHPQLTKSRWFYYLNSFDSFNFSPSSLLQWWRPLLSSIACLTPFLGFFIPLSLRLKSKFLTLAYKTLLLFASAISPVPFLPTLPLQSTSHMCCPQFAEDAIAFPSCGFPVHCSLCLVILT